ncbi:MAG: hypothetical protein MI975_17500 [Cytophagales bacterium]|nr:hypothetical protein [Cytophagales bacterium]
MKYTNNQNILGHRTLADDIYSYISKKDINGIVSVLDKIRTKSEYDHLCNSFFSKYKFSMYNKIWNLIQPKDYEKINLVMRKATC